MFGLESGAAHRLRAEAINHTWVRLVNRASLDNAANSDIQVARKLWSLTAGELKHAEDHMLLLGRKNALEGIATLLLATDSRTAGAGLMALPMCRRDTGDYLGLTLETVSRAPSQLHVEGVLGFSGAGQIDAAYSQASARHERLTAATPIRSVKLISFASMHRLR
ncbi:CRP-like cAMP-binding protein [Bradyrhizobium sp. JR4.1]